MEIKTIAAHQITEPETFTFDPNDYSKFKFGCTKSAKKMGEELANAVIAYDRLYNIIDIDQRIVVLSSPYKYIPTASHVLKEYFVRKLNNYLYELKLPTVQETKIHREGTYFLDYGKMGTEERANAIRHDHFHVDKEFVKGKLCFFIDDIRVTGTHEKVIMNLIETLECDSILLYYARLENELIGPNVEDTLNFYHIKSIWDLAKLIESPDFKLTIRATKYILSRPDCIKFIGSQSQNFIDELYYSAIANEYYKYDACKGNIAQLKTLVS